MSLDVTAPLLWRAAALLFLLALPSLCWCLPATTDAPLRVEYLAGSGKEPHQVPGLGFESSGLGAAALSEPGGPPSPPELGGAGGAVLLRTTDPGPGADGRFYYRPGFPGELGPRSDLRLEVRVRVLRSEGHPCATSVQLPVSSGAAGLGPLTLGQHGEGYQDFRSEGRWIALGFTTGAAGHADDQVLLLDPGGPAGGRVLGRLRVPVDVMRTYVLEVRRGGPDPEDDRISLAVEGLDAAPLTARVEDLAHFAGAAGYGLIFGHPTGAGTAEAEWERVAFAIARQGRPGTEDEGRGHAAGRHASHPGLRSPVLGLPSPVRLGRQRQLFVDDWLIERATGLERRQGVPVRHPGNPVLRREHPWEAARCEVYGSSVWDPETKRLQLFYSAMSVPYHVKLAYAESLDGGSHWRKPELGLFDFEGRKTNIVWPGRYMVSGPCVFRDLRDADPARRYKLFTGDAVVGTPEDKGPQGMEVAFSPDGIHWMPSKRNPVIPRFNSDTTQCAFWDGRLGKYVAYVRLRSGGGRSVGRTESADFETWSEPHLIYTPTPEDRARRWEFYSLSVTPYEGMYVGLVWVFPAVAESTDWNAGTRVTWPELVVSRDGTTWERVAFGQPFVPLGPAGSFDHRQIRTASSLVVLDDRILLVYAGSPHPHVSAHNFDIGLATLRLDGFAAMCAGEAEGSLVTRPLAFEPGALRVNADVEPGGYVKAEALDGRGRPLPGFGASACRPFTGDSADAPLAWKGKGGLPVPGRGGVRLRFLLKRARLYSFRVAGT